jgi:two-component system chemotaxis response regulator CheY
MSPSPCVMVIEDDASLRDTLQEILELEGFSVLAAEHGRQGLALLEPPARPPRLILLDLMMPVMNGWEFLDEVKRDPRDFRAAIPVVVVSAAAPVADELQRLHGCRLLKKPVDIDMLIDLVRAHCPAG